MGVVIPQVIAEDRASGAQVIDGSLKFDNTKFQHLTKTFSNNFGDRQSWTWSGWVKQSSLSQSRQVLFGASGGASDDFLLEFGFDTNGLYATVHTSATLTTTRFRDPSAWLHYFVKYDGTEIKWFVNGVEAHTWSQYSGDLGINGNWAHDIGKGTATGARHFDGSMSQVYFIDGQALGPEYFGFTDPLTNTWRPKKLEQFPKRSFTNPRWYSSPNVYTSVADIVANGTDRGNGGVSLTNEYAYLVFNDGGYAHNGGPNNAPDYPVFTDSMVIGDGINDLTRGFYYNTSNGWTVAGSFSSNASEWNQWRYSNSSTWASYRISNNFELMNSNARFIVFADYDNALNPTLATSFDSVTIPTLDTNSFHFQNSEIDTWNTGGNSYYLPLDGNSPIGEDKFNNGNDWTPVNFGGFNTIEKATGALPILNTISGGRVATVGVRTDAYASNLVLALPLVDEHDVSHLVNSGSTQKVMVPYSNAAASTAESNFYGGSFRFPGGTGDNVATGASSDFNFGSGDYTVEWWMYWTTKTGYQAVFDVGYTDADSFLIQSNTGTSRFIVYAEGGNILEELPAVGDAPLNQWTHYAVVRNGDSMTLYRNGVVSDTGSATAGSVTGTKHGSSTHIAYFGSDEQGYEFNGYLQDFRIYKGVAKYTSEFIPASTNPDILPDTPSGVSGSSKLAKIANGSVGFAGTSRLSIESTSDLDFSTNNFTIEGFFNKTTTTGNQTLLASKKYYTAGNNGNWVLRITDNANIAFATYDGQLNLEYSEFSAPNGVNRWYHFALVREGTGSTQTKFYLDGKFAGSMTLSKSLSDGGSNGIFIGHDDGPNNDLNGFISNVRVIKGTAVYTSDFTPPTEPLTNITNTKLLCAQSTSEHKDITGRLYKSGTVYTTKTDIIANATLLEGGETLNSDYLYYVPNGNELTGQQIFSADGAITNSDSLNANRWGWLHHDGTNWVSTTGSYGTGQFDEFYFGADDTTYQLEPGRDFYALRVIDGTAPEQNGGTAPTLKKQFALDGAVIPSSTNQAIHQLNEPTLSNFNPFDTDINTVRGQETTYATLNPLATQKNGSITLSNGNLTATLGGIRTSAYANLPFVGKMYYEVTFVFDRAYVFGMAPSIDFNTTADTVGQRFIGESSGSYGASDDGNAWNNLVNTPIESFAVGDCMGWAYDSDSGKYSIFKNGINIGTFTADTSRTYYPAITMLSSGSIYELNFGQKPFKFPPPDGFQPLNAANTKPETVIARPDQYVGVTTYTGNSDVQSVNIGFKPDLVWIKARNVNGYDHRLIDSVREIDQLLYSNLDNDQDYGTNMTSFDVNGFTLDSSTHTNLDTQPFVAWCWKAGGSKNTFNIDDVGYATAAAAGLTAGTITPSGASIGTNQGFSIIKYTGTGGSNDETIFHGLSQSPNMVIIKNLTDNVGWAVAHTGTDPGNNRQLRLDTNGDVNDVTFLGLNKSNFTSTTFAVNASDNASNFVNTSSKDYIAYVWHDVPGLQKFGRYEGNGDTNGPYVELGFKPAILWLKNIDDNENWYVYDTERMKSNPAYQTLQLSSNGAEETGNTNTRIDILSSGFKLRQSNGPNNSNSYIYCAWAESPSVNLYGGQSNAR